MAATARIDAARDARLLSLIAIGARGDSRHLDQTLDRLQNHAHLDSHRRGPHPASDVGLSHG